MGQHQWRAAADRFRQASEQARKEAREGELHGAGIMLEQFLASPEGEALKDLLRASGRHVIFHEDPPEGGHAFVTVLLPDGLFESQEAAGMWMAYAKQEDIPQPHLRPLTAREAVDAFASDDRHHPLDIVKFLREQADDIADSAPGSDE